MTNKEWLDYLAHNAPDELAAWFDAEHVETKEQALEGDTEPENEDSRELLEAEIDEWAAAMNLEGYQLDMIHGWLNRRAKIMERKMVEMNQRYFDCVEQEKKIDELQAKVDELKELNEYNALQYELASEDADRLQAQVDELTQVADSKRLSFADRIRFVNEIDELTAERDNWKANCKDWKKDCERYRSKFGKCLDYADAIHDLMDDEGMA